MAENDNLNRDAGYLDSAVNRLESVLADDTAKPAEKQDAYTSFLLELGRFLRRHGSLHVLKRTSRLLLSLGGELMRGADSKVFPQKRRPGRPSDAIKQFEHTWGAAVMTALMDNSRDGNALTVQQAATKVAKALNQKGSPIQQDVHKNKRPEWQSVKEMREQVMKGNRGAEMHRLYQDTVDWLSVSPTMIDEWLTKPD